MGFGLSMFTIRVCVAPFSFCPDDSIQVSARRFEQRNLHLSHDNRTFLHDNRIGHYLGSSKFTSSKRYDLN